MLTPDMTFPAPFKTAYGLAVVLAHYEGTYVGPVRANSSSKASVGYDLCGTPKDTKPPILMQGAFAVTEPFKRH